MLKMRRALFPVAGQRELRAFLVALCTVAAAGSFVLGLTQPVIKLTRLYFWTDTHSIISILYALWAEDEAFLAAIIFIFSIVFPALKLVCIAMAGPLASLAPERQGRWFRHIGWLGKWSMLDVLVLALLVFYAKAAQFAGASTLPGIYFFAASVFLTMAAYSLTAPADPAAAPRQPALSAESRDAGAEPRVQAAQSAIAPGRNRSGHAGTAANTG